MIKYKRITKAAEVIDTRICDKCNTDLMEPLAAQESISWVNFCGWGSVFGDGSIISLDLCQDCIKELLGDYIQDVD